MKHCVTVRAYWLQVLDWIDFVCLGDRGKRNCMVHVDEPLAQVAVHFFKGEIADLTAQAPILDACLPSRWATFEGIDSNLMSGALWVGYVEEFIGAPISVI